MYSNTHSSPVPTQIKEEALTVSAPEMARITGVGRERMRTWERRYGFPHPVRTPSGVRRYLAADVRRVAAVARAIESGMTVANAVRLEREGGLTNASPSIGFNDELLVHSEAPALAITGPQPLRVAWVNRATLAAPDAPAIGAELLGSTRPFPPSVLSQFQALMTSEGPTSCVIDHQDWTSAFPQPCRSLAWRLPASAERPSTVVVLQVPHEQTSSSSPDLTPTTSWVRGARKARLELQDGRGVPSVQRALGTFLKSTGGVDGFLAVARGDLLRTATSVTGNMPARSIQIEHDSDLAAALSGDEALWLHERTATSLGAPGRSRTLAVPIIAGGDRIGAAFLTYRAHVATGEIVDELLLNFGMALGLALQREHRSPAERRQAA